MPVQPLSSWDEPSYSIIPGEAQEWVKLYNTTVKGVRERGVKLGLHVCFGNLGSRPRGKRTYRWMFPDLLDTDCDEIVLEFANREMREVDLLGEIAQDRATGVGLVDVKSFYVETPQDVAERIREGAPTLPAGEDDSRSRLRLLPAPPLAGFPEAPAPSAGRRDRAPGADREAELARPPTVIPAQAGIYVPLP